MFTRFRVTTHRGDDDLLTGGLGAAGVVSTVPPAFADRDAPTAPEVRRRALWSNWRGIADLSPGSGYGRVYGSLTPVAGREYHAFATVPGARHPHRVMTQVPDHFDRRRRCLVVSASSGSRGVYGAIAVAGAWGLPRGCAVAYTDKGAGTDYYDLDAGRGVAADGTVAADRRATTFAVAASGASGVAFPHAHSGDNPEADWGRHVRQAAEFGLQALADACPDAAPFTFDNTCVIAVGLSNGGGAVLRAAEEGDWLDAVVAAAPNVCVAAPGARSLFDYATEAALWMPAAFPHLRDAPHPLPAAQGVHRGASLHASGVVDGVGTAAQARVAYDQLRAAGWEAPAVQAGALSVRFGLWRAVAAAYASAYGRFAVDAHPCGFRYAALDADGAARPATATERASWWSDAGGIPPGAGIGLIESPSGDTDAAFAGLLCLRGLQTGGDAAAQRVQQGVAGTRAGAPRAGLPIVIVHGDDDGLIPPAFSSAPYVAQARAAGGEVAYWRIARVQHFDSFLALPECGVRYRPLLPYIYAALDRIDAALNGQAAGPRDASIAPARASGLPLTLTDLAIPAV